MKKKGKPVLDFQSSEWMQDLAFMVDITQHLNNLNFAALSLAVSAIQYLAVF